MSDNPTTPDDTSTTSKAFLPEPNPIPGVPPADLYLPPDESVPQQTDTSPTDQPV